MHPVVFLTPNPPSFNGGVERFTFYIAKALRDDGFQVIIVDKEVLSSNSKIFLRSMDKLFPLSYELLLSFLLSKNNEIKKHRNSIPLILSNGHCGWALRSESNKNAVSIHHGTSFGFREALKVLGEKRYGLVLNQYLEKKSALGKYIVAVSQNTKQELEIGYKVKVNQVIENGVDTEFFKPLSKKSHLRQVFGLPESKFLGLFVGSNEIRKGIDIVSSVATMLPNDSAIVVLSNKNLNSRNIINLRNVDYLDLPKLYSAVDFFLFPSRYEGCSYSILEAMACGLPFVASNVGHLSRIKRENSRLSEFIVDGHKPDNYAKRIKLLKGNKFIAQEIGFEARAEVLKRNGLEQFANSYRTLVRKLLN